MQDNAEKEKGIESERCDLRGRLRSDHLDILDLKRLLSKLPQEDRTLIYMKFYLGYTLDEISEIVNKTAWHSENKDLWKPKKIKKRTANRGGMTYGLF